MPYSPISFGLEEGAFAFYFAPKVSPLFFVLPSFIQVMVQLSFKNFQSLGRHHWPPIQVRITKNAQGSNQTQMLAVIAGPASCRQESFVPAAALTMPLILTSTANTVWPYTDIMPMVSWASLPFVFISYVESLCPKFIGPAMTATWTQVPTDAHNWD